jgi:hypothetical protein
LNRSGANIRVGETEQADDVGDGLRDDRTGLRDDLLQECGNELGRFATERKRVP